MIRDTSATYPFICSFLFLIAIITIFFYVLDPTEPKFVLDDVMVSNLTNSVGAFTPRLDVTISARNPSHYLGIGYHGLRAYVEYQSQRITAPDVLLFPPDLYQSEGDDGATWTSSLSGDAVILSPMLLQKLNTDILNVTIHVVGRLRGEIGVLKSVWQSFDVNCFASLPLGNTSEWDPPADGGRRSNSGGGLKFALSQPCSTAIS
ncbi:Late embryogenesis abundant (LEA) hydroxyproline-rich glycoprotein family [Trema orientale]|uniref:Late embryogenesis abundant (LEA) hydroxyproline-rich glycoprotein family n=1 Tax=Trema orientale TaxID=63057 RepID=A0A2P5EE09_TREOI|nr:Late embryogenesis abundant (LEA) hydroxyproline-rich glycoprotein family [Trema orientale]